MRTVSESGMAAWTAAGEVRLAGFDMIWRNLSGTFHPAFMRLSPTFPIR
jgi:hypothetical protein